MKHCPKCNSMYADVGLNFCVSDGTPLTDKPRYDSEAETLKNYPPLTQPKLVITAKSRFHPNITFPLKIYLDVANTRREAVAIESNSFELRDSFRLQTGVRPIPGSPN